jgi:hypothetical protein
MKNLIILSAALSLLLVGTALMPSTATSASWISGDDMYAAGWVKEIEEELNKQDYRAVFLNDPHSPQATVLHLLNRAATAFKAKETTVAQDLVQEALTVLEEGVRKHYYNEGDIAPILSSIKQHVPFSFSEKGPASS